MYYRAALLAFKRGSHNMAKWPSGALRAAGWRSAGKFMGVLVPHYAALLIVGLSSQTLEISLDRIELINSLYYYLLLADRLVTTSCTVLRLEYYYCQTMSLSMRWQACDSCRIRRIRCGNRNTSPSVSGLRAWESQSMPLSPPNLGCQSCSEAGIPCTYNLPLRTRGRRPK